MRAACAFAILGVLGMLLLPAALAGPDEPTADSTPVDDVALLMRWWPRLYDTREQLLYTDAPGLTLRPEGSERRMHTSIARVSVPWLGPTVLYLEQFPHDDPQNLTRQLLLVLEAERGVSHGVRVHQYTFRRPAHFAALDRRPGRLAQLTRGELDTLAGCDLHLVRSGNQLRGGTLGQRCIDEAASGERIVDLKLAVSEDLYWYRMRIERGRSHEVEEEIAGFDYFEPFDARLFECAVHDERSPDAHHDVLLELHDQGGRAQFSAANGRRYQIELHGRDSPFTFDRDALILTLREADASVPLASAWTEIDARGISLDLDWVRIDCTPFVPDADDLRS
jgi:hypothetical protein